MRFMAEMLLVLIPLAPLLAAVLAPLVRRAAGWIAVAGVGLAAVATLLIGGEPTAAALWFRAGELPLELGLRFDPLARWMAVLVAWVALPILVYSVGYLREESGGPRFFGWMSFFVAAMLGLVLSDTLVTMFVAWEGVGVASYALIGHRFGEERSRRAARKAFLLTRLGDFGFLLGWLWLLEWTGTTRIDGLLIVAPTLPATVLGPIALLLLLAAVGKSAQLPLTAWLPDAMAGPTPVSALIHSATMVAAGVFLLLRLFPLFEAAGALPVVLWSGGVTAVVAALVATGETDLCSCR